MVIKLINFQWEDSQMMEVLIIILLIRERYLHLLNSMEMDMNLMLQINQI